MNKSIFLLLAVAILTACKSGQFSSAASDGYLPGADGDQLYYRVLGTGQDSILVIHGGPGAGMHTILPSLKPFAEEYVLVFYDQRGGGRSTLPADTTKLQAEYFVEDLEAVRTYFGFKQMNVITHSFGSVLLAKYATQYPNKVKRALFHGATGPRRASMTQMFKKKAELALPSPDTVLSKRASVLLESLLEGSASNPIAACREYETITKKLARARGKLTNYKGTTCKGTAEAVHYYYHKTAQITPRSFGNWDFTTKLNNFQAPLLVVYGRRDSLAIPSQQEWINSVPNGRLLVVPDAHKGAFSDNPDYVFAAADTFFSGHWPEAAQKPEN